MAESTSAMQHVKKRLDEYLGGQPSAVAPASIAQTIAKEFPAAEDDIESYLGTLWQAVTKSAQGTPYHHPAQDKSKFSVERYKKADGHPKEQKWNDLPLLGVEFREMINGPEIVNDGAAQADIIRSWTNFHAFAAKLNGKGVTDWWDIPLWMLRQGLEEDLSTAPKLHDCHIMAAAQIIVYSGAIMLATKVMPEEQLDDTEKRMFAAGSLFKGEAGYTLERWTFWSRRLHEEAEKCSSDEVKNAALRAARLMEIWLKRRQAD